MPKTICNQLLISLLLHTPILIAQDEFDITFAKTIDENLTAANFPYGDIMPGFGFIPRNYNDSVESWKEAMSVGRFIGSEVLQLQAGYWREDEPVKDVYQWQPTERAFQAITEFSGRSWRIAQDIGGPFFHDRLMAPEYLKPIQLTDQRFVTAYLDYLKSYLTLFGSKIQWLLIHAEGSYSYFGERPEHLAAYLNILDQVKSMIRQQWPQVQLGVNIDTNNSATLLQTISNHVDFMGFDIVPVEGFLDDPEDLPKVIEHIMSNTNDKPISMAGGWSSSEESGGEQTQLMFYQLLFQESQKYADRIEYIAIGPPFDEDYDMTAPAYHAQFSYLPHAFVEKIINWATTLGLVRMDGSPKSAFLFLRSSHVKH